MTNDFPEREQNPPEFYRDEEGDAEEFDAELEDMEHQLTETQPSRMERNGPLAKLSQRWHDYKNDRTLDRKAKELLHKEYALKIHQARKDAKIERERAKYEEKLRVARLPAGDRMKLAGSKLQSLADKLAPKSGGGEGNKFTKFFGGKPGDGAKGVQKAIGGGMGFNKDKLNAAIGVRKKGKGAKNEWL